MSAFAALVLLGVASSCKDQNFDWENAHSLTSVEKFTDTFIKEFGQPADGHQWGFDFEWQPGKTVSRAVYTDGQVLKADQGGNDACDTRDYYGNAANITEREHREVYEWFATHQVTWNNTTRVVGALTAGDKLYDSAGNEITYETYDDNGTTKYRASSNSIVVNGKVVLFSDKSEIKGDFIVNNNNDYHGKPANPTLKITKLVSGTGTRNSGTTIEAVKRAELSSDNSLRIYTPECVGNYNVGLTIDFNHAWIQHVASDCDSQAPDRVKDKDLFGYNVFTYDETTGYSDYKMDYIQFYFQGASVTEGNAHTNDFNKQGAGSDGSWGWGNQDKTFTENDRGTYPMNGVLMLGADFDNTTYSCSLGDQPSKIHDKWIIVYLQGEDYAGWYLGFDFESSGDGPDKQIGANGYCTNWIIKLSAVDPNVKPKKARIMCEDLGGINNKVTVGTTVHISDIDYNDVVVDVTPTTYQNGAWVEWKTAEEGVNLYPETYYNSIKLTLRAAGGTLPLTVWYDKVCLFETHEMFQKGSHYNDPNHTNDVDYTIMYRTNADNGDDDAEQRSLIIQFWKNGKYEDGQVVVDGHVIKDERGYVTGYEYGNWEPFDLSKLHLRVWRHSADDYKSQTAGISYSEADWINLSNIAGEAPLKICVPQTVKWLKERHAIHLGYPGFMDWVKNPSDFFWKSGKTINPEHLY